MTDSLTIAMAQLNQRVGDLKGNADAMLDWRAKGGDVDLVLFPEQQLIGYPPKTWC
jgi:NAD+ synthase